MIAMLQPLEGKYYGTKIKIIDGSGIEAYVEIWDNGDYTPSKRELVSKGYTEQQWQENALVDSGWGGSKIPVREIDIVCDSHFESKQSYEMALKIVEKLNRE